MHQPNFKKDEKLKPWSIASPNRNTSPMRSKKFRIVPEEPEILIQRLLRRGHSNSPPKTLELPRQKVRSTSRRMQKYIEPGTEIVLFTHQPAEESYSKQRSIHRKPPLDEYESVQLVSIKRRHSQNKGSLRYEESRFNSQLIESPHSPSQSSAILHRLNKSINRSHHHKPKHRSVKDEKKANLMRFVKRIVLLVKFLCKLTKLCSKNAKKRRLRIESQFNNFDFLIQSAVRHYNEQLYYPLKYYRDLIKFCMRTPNCFYNNEALVFLTSLVNKLKAIGLPIELLNFLKDICLNRCFIPSGLLSKFELKKLNVSSWFGSSIDLAPEASCLIIGHIMCCRIICYELLLQPWQIITKSGMKKLPNLVNSKKIDDNEYTIRQEDFWRYKKVVYDISSAFYTIYIRHFHRLLPNLNEPRIQRVRRNLNIKYPDTLHPFPVAYERDAPLNLRDMLRVTDGQYKLINMGIIPNCNSGFYRMLVDVDDERVEDIRLGMVDWLMRIYNKILVIKVKDQTSPP